MDHLELVHPFVVDKSNQKIMIYLKQIFFTLIIIG